MTYPIANVVYGFPYGQEIQAAYQAHYGGEDEFHEDMIAGDYREKEKPDWQFLYSAGGLDFEPIGYFGLLLFDKAYWELELKEFKPTDAQRERVWQEYMKLPEGVQKAAGEPRVCLVWSDS